MNDICHPRPAVAISLRRPPLLALVLVPLLARAVTAQEWKPVRVWVAGSERSTWVVAGSAPLGGREPILQFWHIGESKTPTAVPVQTVFNPAVSGRPLRLAADVEALRILYPDFSVYYHYGNRRASVGVLWREQAAEPPAAWAGAADRAEFWAVAATASLSAPTTVETVLDGEPTVPAWAAAEPGGPRWTLLHLAGGIWRRLPMPPEPQTGDRFWLAAHSATLHLFWRDAEGALWCVSRRDGEWGSAARVRPSAVEWVAGWAGAVDSGPVFVVGEPAAEGRVTLRLMRYRDGAWQDEGLARDGTEVLALDPTTGDAAVARGRLAVVRLSTKGEVEFGLADLGTSPAVRFTSLRLGETSNPAVRSNWEEALVMGLLMGMVTMLLWSRRERLVRPATLPQGVAPALVSRRVLAAVLDLLPALLLVTAIAVPLMHSRMDDTPTTLDWASLQERAADPRLQSLFAPMQYSVILLYGVWCLAWELAIGTTPGKLVFKCRVLSSTGEPPRVRQVLIRNAVRVVEFALGSPGLLVTFMTMMLVSRNRQRIGDLLADTVVVEPAAAPPPPAE